MKHFEIKHIKLDARVRGMISVMAMLLCFAMVLSVFAAFLSAGHRKGVAVANGYFFSSNVMTDIVDGNFPTYSCVDSSATTLLAVQVRNYDSKQTPDPFDVNYRISYQLIGDAGSVYDYTLSYNGVDYNITSTQNTIENLVLNESQLDFDSFTVRFTRTQGSEPEPEQAAKIRLTAVPTAPIAMTSFLIGAEISLVANTAEFAAVGGFDAAGDNGADTLIVNPDSYAGFIYHVSTSGAIPAGETATVTLSWNTELLELNTQCEYLTGSNYTVDENTKIATLIMSGVDTGEYRTLAFYRTATTGDTILGNGLVTITSAVA